MPYVFDAATEEQRFRDRVDSVERDTRRCFEPMSGLPPAPFPAVLYAFATLDYFSGCWKGWNDKSWYAIKRKKKRAERDQTMRMVEFLRKFFRYGKKESYLAVDIWRHKLMHTGEPRLLSHADGSLRYGWEIDDEGTHHMQLRKHAKGVMVLQFNPRQFAQDLREAIFGLGRYWHNVRHSKNLQEKLGRFLREIRSYRFRRG
jgi:hypothetical protein